MATGTKPNRIFASDGVELEEQHVDASLVAIYDQCTDDARQIKNALNKGGDAVGALAYLHMSVLPNMQAFMEATMVRFAALEEEMGELAENASSDGAGMDPDEAKIVHDTLDACETLIQGMVDNPLLASAPQAADVKALLERVKASKAIMAEHMDGGEGEGEEEEQGG